MDEHFKHQSDLFDKSKLIIFSQYLKIICFVIFGHLLNFL